jgi:hypothetical protein
MHKTKRDARWKMRRFTDEQVIELVHAAPRTVISKLVELKATNEDLANIIVADAAIQLNDLTKFKVSGRMEYDPIRHNPINYLEAELRHQLKVSSKVIEVKKEDKFESKEDDLS